jgi:hypothetical protein
MAGLQEAASRAPKNSVFSGFPRGNSRDSVMSGVGPARFIVDVDGLNIARFGKLVFAERACCGMS